MKKTNHLRRFLTPIRSLTFGFSFLSLVGAIILSLPMASASGNYTPFLDALFTATSAVTTTGLIVVDTGSYYNTFGQTIILILFQVGGLGYMIFISLFVLGFAGKLSMTNRVLLRESINRPGKVDLIKFSKIIIVTTLLIEIIGVIFLTIYWMNYFGFKEALYSAVFHSVSAFTTAGFSIYADSFIKYQSSLPFNLIVISLIVLGSLGFFVLYDFYLYITNPGKKIRRLATHTKLVISLMLILTLTAAGLIFFAEGNIHVNTLKEKIITAIFQAATASTTAGFNTIDIGLMKAQSLFAIIIIMFVGAGPGGTAGGIKLTTFGVLLISLYSQLTGRKNVAILRRKISGRTIQRAIAITLIAALWLIVSVLVLTFSEQKSFIQIFFEVASALGTVGLSAGITGDLSSLGKIIIIITMLIGRVGPLGIGLTVLVREKITSYEYPEDDFLVG